MATRNVDVAEMRAAQRAAYDARREPDGFLYRRTLPNGRLIALLPLFGAAVRLGIGPSDSLEFDDTWDYPFELRDNGWRAALGWDGEGEPEGWYRHNSTGRRRPGGDPAKEFVR